MYSIYAITIAGRESFRKNEVSYLWIQQKVDTYHRVKQRDSNPEWRVVGTHTLFFECADEVPRGLHDRFKVDE